MKLVNTLKDLRNQYPEENPVESNYSGNTLIGKYPQNKIELEPKDIGDITPIPGNFRVLFSIDGNIYASSTYLSELESTDNPYINKSTLPIVELRSSDLINASSFKDREDYAEVTISSTLNSTDDLSKHISWLLDSSQQELRIPGQDYGSYSLNTSTYDVATGVGLGFEFSKEAQKPID